MYLLARCSKYVFIQNVNYTAWHRFAWINDIYVAINFFSITLRNVHLNFLQDFDSLRKTKILVSLFAYILFSCKYLK